MSDETNFVDDEMEFNKETDILPDTPVPAGFHEGVVAQVRREGPSDDRGPSLFPKNYIARVTYRLSSEDPNLDNKRVDDFPMVMKDNPESSERNAWKWFKWCEIMGYDTSKPFKFSPTDVEGVAVSLKFGPPRAGKGKNEGKLYSNLEAVQRLNG